MTPNESIDRRSPLLDQLAWFIRLRWVAGLLVIVGAGVDAKWLGQFGHSAQLAFVGAAVLVYNAILLAALPRLRAMGRGQTVIDTFAGAQILLDLACLSCLTIWTGALSSPVLGFFVFHMVFASMLMRPTVAYLSMAAAVTFVALGLYLSEQWPADRRDNLVFVGWIVTLLFTVYLTNSITSGLRRQRRRLIKQNKRIRRMTRRLQRQRQAMIQHEKMAAMGQMAAGVAHEVANPLASMDSLLQLMQRHPDKPRPDALGTLRDQIGRIKSILQQMNSFARPSDTGWERLSVNTLVEQGLSMVRFDKRARDVSIETNLTEEAGYVLVQPQAMNQVLINLVLNALDALAGRDGARITLATAVLPTGHVTITVSDNGPGIPREHLQRIFEPFFTTKPVGEGTGLGLSISYSLIDSQHGRLSVANNPDSGAAFTITLPAAGEPSRMREAPSGANL